MMFTVLVILFFIALIMGLLESWSINGKFETDRFRSMLVATITVLGVAIFLHIFHVIDLRAP